MADNPRLSALGTTTPSTAGQPTDAVFGPDKLAALLEGTVGLDERLTKARNAPPPTTGREVLSTRNIPMLALAALAAAVGGEEGAGAAAGLVQGTMASANAAAQEKAAVRKQKIDELQDVVDRRRNTITTLLQAQPGLFTDSAGKDAIDPVVLGQAVSGVPIALSPGAIVAERRRTAEQEARVQFWSNQLKNATTPEQGLQAARMTATTLGLSLTPEDLATLATQDETGFWVNLADNSTMDTGSVLSAWLYSIQNGKNRFDPDVIGKLRAKPKTTGGIQLDDVVIGLLDEWNQAVEQNPGLAKIPADQQVETIFRDRPADIALLKQKFKTAEGEPTHLDLETLRMAFINTNNLVNTLFLVAPSAAASLFGSKEGAAKILGDITRASLEQLHQELSGQHAAKIGSIYQEIETAYAEQYPDMGQDEVSALTLQVFNAALVGTTGDPAAPDFNIEALRAQVRAAINAGLPRGKKGE